MLAAKAHRAAAALHAKASKMQTEAGNHALAEQHRAYSSHHASQALVHDAKVHGEGKVAEPGIAKGNPRLRELKSPDPNFKVYLVDGAYIEAFLDPDFIQGTNGYAHPEFCPSDEIWLDNRQSEEDNEIVLNFHELPEIYLMRDGMPYNEAHDRASREIEQPERQRRFGRPQLETPDAAKGDLPGHEFHGNQWTGGQFSPGPEPNSVTSAQDVSEHMAAVVRAEAAQHGLNVAVGKWERTGGPGGLSSRTITVQTPSKEGFAQAVVWRQNSETPGQHDYTITQHDVSLPASERGGVYAHAMMDSLVAGYHALGVRDIPVHMPINPGFWHSVNREYGIFAVERSAQSELQEIHKELGRWRRKAKADLKAGRKLRPFASEIIPPRRRDWIEKCLAEGDLAKAFRNPKAKRLHESERTKPQLEKTERFWKKTLQKFWDHYKTIALHQFKLASAKVAKQDDEWPDPDVTPEEYGELSVLIGGLYDAGAAEAAELVGVGQVSAAAYARERSSLLIGKRWDAELGEWITNPDKRFVIADTIREKVQGALGKAISENVDLDQFRTALDDLIGTDISYRAAMITRTEGREAFNNGAVANFKSMDVTEVEIMDGSGLGDECDEDNGKVVSLDEFLDISASRHPNCTIAAAPVLGGEEPEEVAAAVKANPPLKEEAKWADL
jgi:hypothetical protein